MLRQFPESRGHHWVGLLKQGFAVYSNSTGPIWVRCSHCLSSRLSTAPYNYPICKVNDIPCKLAASATPSSTLHSELLHTPKLLAAASKNESGGAYRDARPHLKMFGAPTCLAHPSDWLHPARFPNVPDSLPQMDTNLYIYNIYLQPHS